MAVYVILLMTVVSLLKGSVCVTPSHRKSFVNYFNYVRSAEAVAQNVSNMWEMEWNYTLNYQARDWVKNCKFGYSHTAGVGEAIFVYPNQLWQNYSVMAINGWMSEKKFNSDKSFSCCSSTCRHYCLTVKDVNTQVGCTIKKCHPVKGINVEIGTLIACKFNSQADGATNYYRHGAPCSACGANTHCVNHLCVHGAAPVER